MSSFAALKQDRRARQRSLAESPGEMVIGDEQAVEAGDVVQEQTVQGQSKIEGVVGETTQSTSEVQDHPSTQNPVDTAVINAEAGPSTSTSSVCTSMIVNPSSLPQYNDFPPTLEVRQSPTSGRGLYVKPGYTIKKAQTILRTTPLSSVLSTSHLSTHCSSCHFSLSELITLSALAVDARGVESVKIPEVRKCSRCGVVRYCGRECQSKDWPFHQAECVSLQRLHEQHRSQSSSSKNEDNEDATKWIPNEDVRALGRICWTRRKEMTTGNGEQMWKQVEALQSHRLNLSPSQREPFARLALRLSQYLAAGETTPSAGQGNGMTQFGFKDVGEVMDLCCAFATNSFTLASPSLSALGLSISPLIALFNHSCEPNAVVVYPNGGLGRKGDRKSMEVVALRDIEEGEEIVTSYIDVTQPYHLRKKDLERYCFECQCGLCVRDKMDQGVDPRWCVKHRGCEKNGVARLPGQLQNLGKISRQCSVCEEGFEVNVAQIDRLVEAGEVILKKSDKTSLDAKTVDELRIVTKKLRAHMPLTSHPLLALLRLEATTLSAPTESTDTIPHLFEAIQASSFSFQGMQGLLPHGHPIRGIVLAELGKLLNLEAAGESTSQEVVSFLPRDVKGRMGLARETMIKALEELRIGFGREGGMVAKEVEMLVEGLTREMRAFGMGA